MVKRFRQTGLTFVARVPKRARVAARPMRGRRAAFGGELKFFDTIKTVGAVAEAGTVLNNCLNIIPQGTTEEERVGRKVVIRKIDVNGIVKLPATTTQANGSDSVRLVLYVDKQTNGLAATIAQLFEDTEINSFLQLANSGRFRILKDWKHSLSASAASGNGTTDESFEAQKHFSWKFSGLSIPIEWDNVATTGALTTVRSNNVGIMGFSESGQMTVQYICRLRFND